MTRVEQLKQGIEELTLEERGELMAWLHGWEDDEWDRQMKRDAAEGKFDKLLERLDSERRAGRLEEWP